MNKYAKLVNGVLFYAPSGMNNILGYNLDSNRERLLADGYKPDPAMLYDALVKINSGNDTLAAEGKEQLSAYVQTCLRVKAEYPKPA